MVAKKGAAAEAAAGTEAGAAEAPEGGLAGGAEQIGAAYADGTPGCGPQPDRGIGAQECLD
ncbi:hypothetical protein ACFU0X_35035, partial [Streptomyces cellulosae]